MDHNKKTKPILLKTSLAYLSVFCYFFTIMKIFYFLIPKASILDQVFTLQTKKKKNIKTHYILLYCKINICFSLRPQI